jgi:hypothetical protein
VDLIQQSRGHGGCVPPHAAPVAALPGVTPPPIGDETTREKERSKGDK